MKWSENFVNYLTLILLPIYIGIHAYLLPKHISYSGIEDAGFISIITLTFVACAFFVILKIIFDNNLASSKLAAISSAYILFIYFLREADFHRLFTVEHVTRGKFYTMVDVPIWQKLFSAIVFFILIVCILYVLIKHIRTFLKCLRISQPWAISILLWFCILAFSQFCDKSDLNDTYYGRVIEECCECWAAMFLFLATIQLAPILRSKSKTEQPLNPLHT